MDDSRRNFLKLSGAGIMAVTAPAILAGDLPGKSGRKKATCQFELGIASYTFREFSLEETISMTQRLGIGNLCLKSMHLPLEWSGDQIRSEAEKVKAAGIRLYGAGVIYMKSEKEVEDAFAYAGHAGLELIVGVPEHHLLELCNRKVKETGVMLAIHNHGPGDEKYPSPESAYKLIRDLDPGLGLCVDIGHTVRMGLDPVMETARFMDRVLDIHIKDETRNDEAGTTCEMGRGVIDIHAFLQMLLKEEYNRVVSFEYEKDEKDPLAGLAESVGYVRGMMKVIA